MEIRDKFYEIMEQEEKGYEEIKEEVSESFSNAKSNGEIKDFIFTTDEDVFDSCGLDIYYISVSWIDEDDKLQIAGASYYSS